MDFWTSLASQPGLLLLGTLQARETLKEQEEWLLKNDPNVDFWLPHVHKHLCTHSHTICNHLPLHTCTHKAPCKHSHIHTTQKHATTHLLCIYTSVMFALHLSLAKLSETWDKTTKISASNSDFTAHKHAYHKECS